jgi:succinate-semialdehyde dehydrogenase/glutarate-semialdehyde dehydrogenase
MALLLAVHFSVVMARFLTLPYGNSLTVFTGLRPYYSRLLKNECLTNLTWVRFNWVAYGVSFQEWFAEEANCVNGETLPEFDNNRRLMVIRQPIEVSAVITLWKFPIAMITCKVPTALAAACSVVVKPAEATPLTALAVFEIAIRGGVWATVINTVTVDGNRSIAIEKVSCASETVRSISFAGSTEVG